MAKTTIKKLKKVDLTLTIDQLTTELKASQADLMELKRGHQQGELINPIAIRFGRRQIARQKTAIRNKQLAKNKEEA